MKHLMLVLRRTQLLVEVVVADQGAVVHTGVQEVLLDLLGDDDQDLIHHCKGDQGLTHLHQEDHAHDQDLKLIKKQQRFCMI